VVEVHRDHDRPAAGLHLEHLVTGIGDVTLVVPYYRNCEMLRRQIQEWELYPAGVQIIVVDDGSPELAKPIIENTATPELQKRIQLFRIMVDIPWNREEARNLGALQASTKWIVQVDIDHVLPAASARHLLQFEADSKHWYRFPRWRKGKADETRNKDAISRDVEFGQIHPHVDSYLISKVLYWLVDGYDLLFSGCLGGGRDFLKRLENVAQPLMLPHSIPLHVYTRSEVKDASDWSLSRDTSEGKARAKQKRSGAHVRRNEKIRSQWERQL
jgi:glycosyltransferase involved in cell wall biosynthesis